MTGEKARWPAADVIGKPWILRRCACDAGALDCAGVRVLNPADPMVRVVSTLADGLPVLPGWMPPRAWHASWGRTVLPGLAAMFYDCHRDFAVRFRAALQARTPLNPIAWRTPSKGGGTICAGTLTDAAQALEVACDNCPPARIDQPLALPSKFCGPLQTLQRVAADLVRRSPARFLPGCGPPATVLSTTSRQPSSWRAGAAPSS